MPRASVTQAMVFAVYIPWQDPTPGQAHISRAWISSSPMRPFLYLPIASKVSFTRESLLPLR